MIQKKLIASENNLLLLKFLSSEETVKSRKEWVRGTFDWLGGRKPFYNLLTATHSMPRDTTMKKVVGPRHEFAITTYGRDVLTLKEPIWVRGKGWLGGVSDDGKVLIKDRV
jgi:hypothetical protein